MDKNQSEKDNKPVSLEECVNEAAKIIGERTALVSQGKASFDDDDRMMAEFILLFKPELACIEKN